MERKMDERHLASSLCVCWCGSPPNYLSSTLNYWMTMIKSCPAPSSVNLPTGTLLPHFINQRLLLCLSHLNLISFILNLRSSEIVCRNALKGGSVWFVGFFYRCVAMKPCI